MQPRVRLLLPAAMSVAVAVAFSVPAAAVPSPASTSATADPRGWVVTPTGRFEPIHQGDVRRGADVAEDVVPARHAVDAIFPVTASAPATDKPPVRTRRVPVVEVRGITVHRRIAAQTTALLRASDRADVRLGGRGYRSTRRQIELRREHCGASRYALYRMPAGRCWPPTAQPGKSMHERGLAVDFHVKGPNGETLRIGGTREFRWLKRNAAKYGFYNLPSEPWHWSVNGR